MASSLYGNPRFTNDLDVVVDLESRHLDSLLQKFPQPPYYISEAAVKDAILRRTQFNIIDVVEGFKVDVMVPERNEFNTSRFARKRILPLGPTAFANYASPEDVVLKKMEYYRDGESEKHIKDIETILQMRNTELDFTYLRNWSERLGLSSILERFVMN
ncbi:MAG: hypothetical protein QM811_22320 [Pirellulales bacterium]